MEGANLHKKVRNLHSLRHTGIPTLSKPFVRSQPIKYMGYNLLYKTHMENGISPTKTLE